MRKRYIIVTISALTLFYGLAYSEKQSKLTIHINTKSGHILINGEKLTVFKPSVIEKVIAKPDRTESHKSRGYIKKWRIKEFNKKKLPPVIHYYPRTNYYYLYDKLGMMFFTNNLKEFPGNNKTAKFFSIYFLNKVKHPHKPRLFKPKTTFTGDLYINGVRLRPDKTRFPKGLDHWDKTLQLYNTTFRRCGKSCIFSYEENTGTRFYIYFNPNPDRGISFLELEK